MPAERPFVDEADCGFGRCDEIKYFISRLLFGTVATRPADTARSLVAREITLEKE